MQDVYSRSVEKEYLGDDSFVGSLAKMSSALTKVAITGGAALLDSGTLDELKEGAAGNNSEEENRSRTTARGGLFEAGGNIELGSEGDQIYRGTDFKAGNDISLTSEEGKVALLSIKDTENYSKTVKGKGALWQTDKGEGSYDESLKFGEMSAGGKINIRAKEGVDADIQKREITYYEETPYGRVKRTRKETNREAIDRMVAEDPSKAWMSSLYQSGDLTLTSVEEKHEDWQYDNSGMTKEAQLAVSIAVSAAIPGGGMVAAGLSSLSATGAVNVINSVGRGDGLHSGLQATFSEDNLKAAGVAMVTAGAGQYMQSAKLANYVGGDVTKRMFMSGISGGLTTGDSQGFFRGMAAGVIPADMWTGDVYMNNAIGNTLVTGVREYTRGYIVNGTEGAQFYLKGAIINNAVGHAVGLYNSDGKAPNFRDGVWKYDSSKHPGVSIGNAISVKKPDDYDVTFTHERQHSQFQDVLGPWYLPLHLVNQGIHQSDNDFTGLECPSWMPEDNGGYTCK